MSGDVRRKAKGVAFIELVKILKGHRRNDPISGLSAEAESLLADRHLLPTAWYPLAPVAELIQVSYRQLLRSREEAALQMGMAGGAYALSTYHKTFITPGDPRASRSAGHAPHLAARLRFRRLVGDGRRQARGRVHARGLRGCQPRPWLDDRRVAPRRGAGGGHNGRTRRLACPWSGRSSRLVHRVQFK
jgi:hypothetical protein